MPLHVRLNVHGTPIDIHIFVDDPLSEAKARGLAPYLQRMPSQHVQRAFARYLVFIIRDKPRGGPGGGTWRPGGVRRAFWDREGITGVPNADLQRLVLTPGKGLIGIPLNRWQLLWQLPIPQVAFTVLHEAGHSVDYEMNLTPPGVSEYDYRGVTPVCGGRDVVKRHAVEAYARFILVPRRICREPVAGESAAACNQRVIALLRRSPAFSSLPPNWMPGP